MKWEPSLVEVIDKLRKKGYESDFNLSHDCIECTNLKLKVGPDDFHVDYIHRFDDMTSPDDSSILYAITTSSGVKGILLDAYGAYSGTISQAMTDKLRIDESTLRNFEDLP